MATLARVLLRWYDAAGRDLPWRRQPSAYGTLVSELMLQQTVVSTVAPRFEAFLRRFPSIRALAAADEAEVLAAWSGLGYYSRARRLHDAARVVVREHAGVIPDTVAGLLRLPGVGPYTARAVAAIAFDIPEVALDGNAIRVLCRLLDVRENPDTAAVRRHLQQEGDALVPARRAGAFVQALMDLGATVCIPRRPRCTACPVARWCAARRAGSAATLPTSVPRPKRRLLRMACVRILRAGAVLLVRRPPGQLLAGTWMPPSLELRPRERPTVAARAAAALVGMEPGGLERAGRVKHILTHRELVAEVYDVRLDTAAPRARGGAEWFRPSRLGDIALSTFTRKVLAL